jgi:hypothetical protein
MLKVEIDKKKKNRAKKDIIKKMEDNFKKQNYLILLLNKIQQVNFETFRLDFLFSPSLKLTRMRVDFT